MHFPGVHMKSTGAIVVAAALLAAVVWLTSAHLHAQTNAAANTLYSPDPHQIWNRLNEALFLRTLPSGMEFLLIESSFQSQIRAKKLLAGPSYRQAIAVLDEFIHTHAERLVRDPFKRALMQRDLWALFDWCTTLGPSFHCDPQRTELQDRLAVIIRRLALTTNEIAALPDNYALLEKANAPGLTRGLFDTNGPWVNLSPDPSGIGEIAPVHDHYFGACSPFLVMMRVPGGRPAATNYLNKLDSFNLVWVYATNQFNDRSELEFNPNLPQFPAGTEFALVRRMCVIDTAGKIVPTPITEDLELRRYLAIVQPRIIVETNRAGGESVHYIPPMQFFAFQMDRKKDGLLRAVGERRAPQPSDSESGLVKECFECHQSAGIHSVNCYTRLFQPQLTDPPKLYSNPDINHQIRGAIDWKERQFSWGLLQGLWRQEN
jgi:hypothetical protein